MKEAYPASPVASLLGRHGGELGGGFCGWGATEGAPQDWNERKTAVPGWGGGQCGREGGDASGHRAGGDVPDFLGVFGDGAVGAEFAGVGDVHQAHAGPAVGLFVDFRDLGLLGDVGGEFVQDQEVVAVRQQGVPDGLVEARLVEVEEVVADGVQDAADVGVVVVDVPRVVAGAAEGFDFFDGFAEEEEVVGADFFADFDVGACIRAFA